MFMAARFAAAAATIEVTRQATRTVANKARRVSSVTSAPSAAVTPRAKTMLGNSPSSCQNEPAMPTHTKPTPSHAAAGGTTRPPSTNAATERSGSPFAGTPGKPIEWSVIGMAFDRHLIVIHDHNSDERAMKAVSRRNPFLQGRPGASRCSAQGTHSRGAPAGARCETAWVLGVRD